MLSSDPIEATHHPITILVPIALYEDRWRDLMDQLRPLWGKVEILLIAEEQPDPIPFGARWIDHNGSLNDALNTGVQAAQYPSIWILPADSMITASHVDFLIKAIKIDAKKIYYFNLGFEQSESWLMIITREIMMLQARLFSLPASQHGVCFPKSFLLSHKEKPSQTQATIDYALAMGWRAKKQKIVTMLLPMTLITSARRYRDFGWFYTTITKASRFIQTAMFY